MRTLSRWENKVDHRLRALWARVPDSDRASQSVRVLFRFIGTVEGLKITGLKVGSVAGEIATGTVVLDDLPRIAAAPEIIFMELAQPLGPD
ncbi:MAG: hypothetical protein ACR2H4_16090 [Pyrinomonadaceae bacterium]